MGAHRRLHGLGVSRRCFAAARHPSRPVQRPPPIDMRYADYGLLVRWLEWGINVHMGGEFGVPNKVVLVAVRLAIVMLCVSAGMMWWKPARRCPGRTADAG
ncbi:MAG TPA: PepSY domain-containing protein [Ramlibacter sp.]|nr:PepSY domain-containing protein [Ramlibacter sp.]